MYRGVTEKLFTQKKNHKNLECGIGISRGDDACSGANRAMAESHLELDRQFLGQVQEAATFIQGANRKEAIADENNGGKEERRHINSAKIKSHGEPGERRVAPEVSEKLRDFCMTLLGCDLQRGRGRRTTADRTL